MRQETDASETLKKKIVNISEKLNLEIKTELMSPAKLLQV